MDHTALCFWSLAPNFCHPFPDHTVLSRNLAKHMTRVRDAAKEMPFSNHAFFHLTENEPAVQVRNTLRPVDPYERLPSAAFQVSPSFPPLPGILPTDKAVGNPALFYNACDHDGGVGCGGGRFVGCYGGGNGGKAGDLQDNWMSERVPVVSAPQRPLHC